MHESDVLASRLNDIEERLDRMEKGRRHADAMTPPGTTLSSRPYNGRSWKLYNHAGAVHLSSEYTYIVVIFGHDHVDRLLQPPYVDVDPIDIRQDIERAMGADALKAVLQRCSDAYRSDGSETFTCGQVGSCSKILATERGDRDLEDALYELVMKQRHPDEVVAWGLHGTVIRLRAATDDVGSRTWLEKTMEILESGVQLVGWGAKVDGCFSIYREYDTNMRGQLHRAMVDNRLDDIKRIVMGWNEKDRAMEAMNDEHNLLNMYSFWLKHDL
jgi:hypothetical protein